MPKDEELIVSVKELAKITNIEKHESNNEKYYSSMLQKNRNYKTRHFTILRDLNGTNLKISINFRNKSDEAKTFGILIKVFEKSSKEPEFERFINLDNFIDQIVTKLMLNLPLRYDLAPESILCLESFIESLLIYFSYVYYKKSENKELQLCFSFLQRPIGCCPYKMIEFKFLSCLCTIDILVLAPGILKYFIFNSKK